MDMGAGGGGGGDFLWGVPSIFGPVMIGRERLIPR
jgi:hypothetical protein